METESIREILHTYADFTAIRIKFPRKRAFIAWLRKEKGIPVFVETETMNISISSLRGVQTLEKVNKPYPAKWA